jgi:hypothetical protein
MSVVVWDIETQGLIKHSPGFDREEQVRNLEVSCLSYMVIPSAPLLAGDEVAAAAAVEAAPMATLWRDEDEGGVGPFRALFEAFDAAELIVGYNSLGFDHPVLYKHCERRRTEKHLFKVHDAFARLRDHTSVWFKLDHLLQANGLATKTADGLQAIEWWKQGERTLLREYCEQDVRALARLLVLREIKLPKIHSTAPNYVFGISSALAARRASEACLQAEAEVGAALEQALAGSQPDDSRAA